MTMHDREAGTDHGRLMLLEPVWPAPAGVRACTTLRSGGVSATPFTSLNLATHVGDEIDHVSENRCRLHAALQLPRAPSWLTQVHGTKVVDAANIPPEAEADAAFTHERDVVCAVLTADCLPVLLCDLDGSAVGIAHAGWRGLLNGVIENTVHAMRRPGVRLLAWLGPAIGPEVFEVGGEVRDYFIASDPAAAAAFRPSPAGRWLADIYQLARLRLRHVGVTAVYGGDRCTVTDPTLFYSFRRDGVTGRMASLIWLKGHRK